MVYCDGVHLGADSLAELHKFAGDVGLKREWFQAGRGRPHYDILSPRILVAAIICGAELIDRRGFVKRVRVCC